MFLNFLEFAVEGIEGQGKAALGDVQIKFDFLGRRERMDHAGHGAQLVGGVKADDPLRGGGHGDGDPVALFQAERGQGIGAAVDFGPNCR